MSICYFFNSPATFSELAEQMRSRVGINLCSVVSEPEQFTGRFLALDLELQRHEFVNDCGIDFESFEFQLTTTTFVSNSSLRSYQTEAMVLLASALQQALSIHRHTSF